MKKNMKKIMAVLSAMLMIFALAACGNNSSNNNNQQGATNDGPSAYELYTAASEKMNDLDSAEYNLNIDMNINADGQSVAMTMGGNMKQVKTGEADTDFDLAFNMNMDMSAMGAGAMDVTMYYTNGYLYYDMGELGQMKAAMDIETAEAQMNTEGMAELEESWVKESSVDGNNIHLVVDGSKMTEYAGAATSSMPAGSDMTIGDVTIDLTTDAEGMPTTYKMAMPITVTAEGQTMTMDMDMTMDVVATGDVVIDFPEGMDSWMEVDASMLQ